MIDVPFATVKSFVNEYLQKEQPRTRLRQAVITNVRTNGRVDLTLGGSQVELIHIARLASYTPTVNETVWVAQTGPDLLVVGRVSQGGTSADFVKLSGDTMTGQLIINNTNYLGHLRIERPGTGANVVELTPSTDDVGSLRVLVDDVIAMWLSPNGLSTGEVYLPDTSGTSGGIFFGGTTPDNAIGFYGVNTSWATMYVRGTGGSNGWKVRGGTGTGFSDLFNVHTSGRVDAPDGDFRVGSTSTALHTTSGGAAGMVYRTGFLCVARNNTQMVINQSDNGSGTLVSFRQGGTNQGEIHMAANGAMSYSNISDERAKQNIRTAIVDDACNKVKQLRTVRFQRTGATPDEEDDFGVIAQEVREVAPWAVTESKSNIEDVGSPPGLLAVDYGRLSLLSFAAVQDLIERVEVLEGQR